MKIAGPFVQHFVIMPTLQHEYLFTTGVVKSYLLTGVKICSRCTLERKRTMIEITMMQLTIDGLLGY